MVPSIGLAGYGRPRAVETGRVEGADIDLAWVEKPPVGRTRQLQPHGFEGAGSVAVVLPVDEASIPKGRDPRRGNVRLDAALPGADVQRAESLSSVDVRRSDGPMVGRCLPCR